MAKLWNKRIRGSQGSTNKIVFFSIKNKLIGAFAFLLIVPTILLSIVSYQTAKQNVDKQMVQTAEENVRLLDALLNDYFDGKKREVEILAQNADMTSVQTGSQSNLGTSDTVRKQLRILKGTDNDTELVYAATSQGLYLDSSDVTKIAADYNPTLRVWYKQAMANKGKVVVTSPYKSVTSGNQVVTVAKATQDGQGVVGIDVTIEKMSIVTKSVQIGAEGYVFLLDQDKKFVYHPTSEIGSKAEDNPMITSIYKDASGSFDYEIDHQAKKMIFTTNSSTGWKIAATMYQSEVSSQAAPILKSTVIVLVSSLIVGAVLVVLIIFSILRPLGQISRASLAISEGNLTEDINVKRNDELGILGQNFNTMAASLRSLLFRVNDNSMQLAASAEELSASSEQITASGKQVAETAQLVSLGTGMQVNEIASTREDINRMADQMQTISHSTQDVVQSVEHTQKIAEEGNSSVQSIVDQMKAIGETVKKLAQEVTSLGERSKEIDSFTQVITEIATQTNLLALNASIEAARAGEQGRGFAVVASEIKKLADQSGSSASHITESVTAIQRDTQMTAASMEQVIQEVLRGVDRADSAGVAFGHILDSITGVTREIEQVSQASKTMVADSVKVLKSIEAVAMISEDTAASVEQVAASTEEQLASMEEVSASSALLSRMAEELQETVSKFKM
ncbi:methyl-accepting chemotaxis protein [Paenibacillus sp. CAA11]|uniref:methyl-accepting chemotaxis protein n=1 Tax=Paenibacillus sp. CAA11 TaxID=1532905 RepID=UPI000D3A4161|nr:methyl-accepting chemotaxis protein [Paenibacillus sp. CAA11]AWB43048.1 methyl-accepting chemotaxis protein [Paenibacillus sp. CAA11]